MDNIELTESAISGQVKPRFDLNSLDVFGMNSDDSRSKELSSIERRDVDCADSELCFADPYIIGDGVADDDVKFEPRTGPSNDAAVSNLETGDILNHDGDKTTLRMPSGEQLIFNGTMWSLVGRDGDKIASNVTGESTLLNDASLDRVIPLIGPSWTSIHYPNGDQISIRGDQVTVTRGEEISKFPLPTPLVNY